MKNLLDFEILNNIIIFPINFQDNYKTNSYTTNYIALNYNSKLKLAA